MSYAKLKVYYARHQFDKGLTQTNLYSVNTTIVMDMRRKITSIFGMQSCSLSGMTSSLVCSYLKEP